MVVVTSPYAYSRIGPVRCPACGRTSASLSTLASHLETAHSGLGQRERALIRDRARREAGWFPLPLEQAEAAA